MRTRRKGCKRANVYGSGRSLEQLTADGRGIGKTEGWTGQHIALWLLAGAPHLHCRGPSYLAPPSAECGWEGMSENVRGNVKVNL